MDLRVSPYPYFTHDGCLAPTLINDIRRNWPGSGYFVGEIPGNYVCDLAQFQAEGFWQKFIQEIVPALVFGSLQEFAGWIEARFPGEDTFLAHNYSLMQSRGDYGGHDVHTHHYHDPLWVATLLLYLDAEVNGHHGTTVMKALAGDEAEIAAQTLNWQGYTEEHETVAYQQGRLLVLHDNPIAYHSVKPSAGVFGRRILRLHIGVDHRHCERLYGVGMAEYQARRLRPTKDETVLGWMRRDLEQLRNPVEVDKAAWANKLRLVLRADPAKVVPV